MDTKLCQNATHCFSMGIFKLPAMQCPLMIQCVSVFETRRNGRINRHKESAAN